MIQGYRLLAAEMYRLGWDYPLHLGVTEAGEGEDGRMKSAIGIGALVGGPAFFDIMPHDEYWQEVRGWDELKWRPSESQYHNYYKKWYSLGGRLLTLCAEEIFCDGSAAGSTEKVQQKVEDVNKQLELDQLEGEEARLA